MRDVFVVGVGMTRFAKYPDRSIKYLAGVALERSLSDARLNQQDIEAVWFSNSACGFFAGQHAIRGQVALRERGIEGVPITNVENAGAGGATAFHLAWLGVASGLHDCVLAIGAEKLCHEDGKKTARASQGGVDVGNEKGHAAAWANALRGVKSGVPVTDGPGAAEDPHSVFMDIRSGTSRWHMAKFGTTQHQLAVISSKNHFHSSLNPFARFQREMSVEEVLAARLVRWPLTIPMCAPMGDGAAAVILCSGEHLRRLPNPRPVKVRASVLCCGSNRPFEDMDRDIAVRLSRLAFEKAGVAAKEIDVAEVHDTTAFEELRITEALGFCAPGEGGPFAESGATRLGGKIPINTSGGLESRGHPIGASGLAQINELVTQLRHEAGQRQVRNCRMALAENSGGNLGFEEAAMGIHILERVLPANSHALGQGTAKAMNVQAAY